MPSVPSLSQIPNPKAAGASALAEGERAAVLLKIGALQKAILGSANFSSIATDETGVIQIFNVGAEKMLGYSAADVVNKMTPAELSDPQELADRARVLGEEAGSAVAPGFEALVFKAARGIEDTYEMTCVRRDGSRVPAIVSVTALRDDDGRIIGYLLLGTDNTARKNVEEDRNKLDLRLRDLAEKKKLEEQNLRSQRMESIGTLAGGIAHDLNNVLAPILMAIELLKQGDGDKERRDKILETIFASCHRGADLVRQVLSFARGVGHQRVAIRIWLLIDELTSIIKQTFPRNIRITSNVPDGLWPITGDPSQLHQVLLNLCVNARDSMPKGGRLTISASNVTIDAQFAATSNGAAPGTYILLTVSDTGCGIPPEVRDRIFEPFFTTKEVGKGTGLGLATVHTLVKSHGGFLNLESEVGEGTTFKIYLPADLAIRAPETTQPFPIQMPRGRDELVLVVDDEYSILEITQQTLEAFGYRVVTARNGAEAVSLYAKRVQEVALVLTDMMMPIMDGVATIHVLGCINPNVRIIAATGLELAENMAKANNAGVRDFLQKPYTAETLVRKVREVIDRPMAAKGHRTPAAESAAAPA
jgi:signal transduction histidine kinase/ActR/RegA family two-component response regulator